MFFARACSLVWLFSHWYICATPICLCFFFFFFKQKTAYEMRISDWSSDVCSSDLRPYHRLSRQYLAGGHSRRSRRRAEGDLPRRQDAGGADGNQLVEREAETYAPASFCSPTRSSVRKGSS